MARTSTYLNYMGKTEEAFRFYASVFGTEISALSRMSDFPTAPGMPPLSEKEKNYIMNVQLPILGGHVLMGTDALESHGPLTFGNNVSLNLEPDTRKETERHFQRLGEGGKVDMPLQDMFWGAYFGYLTDKFGVKWMFNCAEKK